MAAKVYAVRVGTVPGLYPSWSECEAQVRGFPGAEFKSFKSEADANAWLGSAGAGESPAPEASSPPPAAPPPQAPPPDAPTAPDTPEAPPVDTSGDLPPWDLSDDDATPPTAPLLAPTPSTHERAPERALAPTPAPPTSTPPAAATDYRQQLADKARALLAHLQNEGVPAYATALNSPYHERIGIEHAGFLDLYHTKKRPFDLRAATVLDPERREQVIRFWRELHYGGPADVAPRSPWDAVEHYHALLAPYAALRFDFVALARALRNAAPQAPDPEAVRFDFPLIDAAYHELRPQTP